MVASFVAIIVLAVIFLVAINLAKKSQSEGSGKPAKKTVQYRKKQFMTPNEKDFYKKIIYALKGTNYVAFPQVSMGALIDSNLPKGTQAYMYSRYAFQSKVCDFVVCKKSDFEPVAILELDDVTHEIQKDVKRDSMTLDAGIPTLRFWSRNKPDAARLREIFEKEFFEKE